MYCLESKHESEAKKKAVNNAIRICIKCGNTAIRIENYGIFCMECNSFFDREEN